MYRFLCEHKFSVHLGKDQEVLLLEHRVCLPKQLHCLAFPPAMNESARSTFSPAFGVFSILNFGHRNRCIVVSHYFNLQFPNDIVWALKFLLCYGLKTARESTG